MQSERKKVFICYDEDDYNVANKLYNDLNSYDIIKPWMKRIDLKLGQKIKETIKNAINENEFFIPLLSSKGLKKGGKETVHRDIKIAIELEKDMPPGKTFIIPARLDDFDTSIPPAYPELENICHVDFFDIHYNNGLEKILDFLLPNDRDYQSCKEYYKNFRYREIEVGKTCEKKALKKIIFEAPSGYGKTKLLKRIGYKHDIDNWVCIYIEIPETVKSAFELGCIIAQQCGYYDVVKYNNINSLVLKAVAELINAISMKVAPGVILLVDCIERLSITKIDTFFKSLIDNVQNKFTLKIYLAGRYTGVPLKIESYNHIPLRLFNFKEVEGILKLSFPQNTSLTYYAAHLFHLTNGHPGCIEKIINTERFKTAIESQKEPNYKDFHNEIFEIVSDFKNTIPDRLQNILDVVCIFRYLDLKILKKILKLNFFEYSRSAKTLETVLNVEYFMELKNGVLQDNITRAILSNRPRFEKSECDNYIRFCEAAASIYKDELSNSAISNPERMTVECIYQNLQLAFFKSKKTKQARKTIYDEFFSEDGILDTYLKLLLQRYENTETNTDFDKLLSLENQNDFDWEFQFTVNFILREDQYNNEPYETMIQKVKEFFKIN